VRTGRRLLSKSRYVMILSPFYGLPLLLRLLFGDEKLLLELSESTHDDPILRFLTLIPPFLLS
jgi:hypothetical protein